MVDSLCLIHPTLPLILPSPTKGKEENNDGLSQNPSRPPFEKGGVVIGHFLMSGP